MLEFQSRFKPLLSKRASLVLALWGEAGIGKSHTASEVLQALPCRHARFHSTTPIAALIAQLPPAKKLPLWAERILERVVHGEPTDPSQLISALAALLSQLAPFVLYLEDIHEADAERLALIDNLAQALLRVRGVALIVSSRVEPPEVFTALRLKPLARPASDALLEQKMNAHLPTAALGWIYNQAQGNPLYTLEYLRYLSRQGYLWSDGNTWHWRTPEARFIPTTVEALIAQLINQATSEPLLRYVLEAKAILPLSAPPELWAKIARVSGPELQGAVRELSRRGIFYQQQFIHPLFREITQQMLSPQRRHHLARRAITVLADEPEQAALFLDDAQLDGNTAIGILRTAAAQANSRNDPVQSARHLAQASHYAEGALKAQLAFEAALGLQHTDIHESIRLARLAVQIDPKETSIYFLAAQLMITGRSQEAQEVLGLLPVTAQDDPEWLRRLIVVYGGSGAYGQVVELWRNHPELHQNPGADVAYAVTFSLVILNAFSEADAIARAALADSTAAFDRCRLLIVRGLAQMYGGHLKVAESFFNEAIVLAVTHHLTNWQAIAHHNRSIMLELMGRYPEMLQDIQTAALRYADYGETRRYASTQTKLARFYVEQGKYEQAEGILLECRELLSQSDPSAFLVTCESALSDLYREWRPPHAAILARKHAQDALTYAQLLGHPNKLMQAQTALGKVAAWQGDAELALKLCQAATQAAQSSGDDSNIWLALEGRAAAFEARGQYPEACYDLQQALSLAQGEGDELSSHRLALELSRLKNDVQQARAQLAWFKQHGFEHGVTLAKRYFPALADQPLPPPDPAPIRLEVLGNVQLVISGRVTTIRGQKRTTLLAQLLEARIAGRTNVNQLELIERLYSADPEDVGLSALKQLVFQLRKQLGPNIILRSGDGYALGNISSDAEDFLQNGHTQLWRGNYCEDLEIGDDTVASALYQALYERAAELLKQDSAETSRLGRLLLDYDPYNLEALHLTVRALNASQQYTILSRLYASSRTALTEVGTQLPEHWTDFLAAQSL